MVRPRPRRLAAPRARRRPERRCRPRLPPGGQEEQPRLRGLDAHREQRRESAKRARASLQPRRGSQHSLRPTAVPMAARGQGGAWLQEASGDWRWVLSVIVKPFPLAAACGSGRAEEAVADGGGGAGAGMEGGEAGGGGGGLLQQILSLRLVPRMGNGTTTYSSPLSTFPGTSLLGAGPARRGRWTPAGPGPPSQPFSPQRCGTASSCGQSSPPLPSMSRPRCLRSSRSGTTSTAGSCP